MRLVDVAALVLALALPAVLGACGEGRAHDVREWRPSDHQPPPADQAGESPVADETTAAAALWSTQCAGCHGLEGHGDGPQRPPIARVPDLTDPQWQASRTDEALATVIMQGRGMMPAFGPQLAPAGIAALVQHVRTLH